MRGIVSAAIRRCVRSRKLEPLAHLALGENVHPALILEETLQGDVDLAVLQVFVVNGWKRHGRRWVPQAKYFEAGPVLVDLQRAIVALSVSASKSVLEQVVAKVTPLVLPTQFSQLDDPHKIFLLTFVGDRIRFRLVH
jgi:hypothetical protein